MDYFAALGLPRRLVIDPADLERLYHELGRRIHPDRFATQAASLREASLKSTALLTASYRTLRDPVSRGRYWLELNGEKLAEHNKQVPPELAEMVFEVQEQLAELRAERDGRAPGRELLGEVAARRREVAASIQAARAALAANFAAWDRSQPEERAKLGGELKVALSKIAYLGSLIRDVDRELEPAGAA